MNRIKVMVVTYAQMHKQIENMIEEIGDGTCTFSFFDGYLLTLESAYEKWCDEGVEVIIATGGNYTHLKGFSKLPLINIPLTTLNYIKAIKSAEKENKAILMPYYETHHHIDLETLNDMTDKSLHALRYQDEEHLEALLLERPPSVVVGGCLACEIAERLGHEHVLLLPSKMSVLHAVDEAIEVAQHMRQEKEKRRLFEAVLQYSPNGILAVDRKSKIILLNPHGAKMLGISSQDVIGKTLDGLDPIFQKSVGHQQRLGLVAKIGPIEIVLNWLPFEGGTQGVFIFQKVSDIVKTEQTIRLSHQQKGLMAKATFSDIIGECKSLTSEIKRAKLYAQSDSNILIYGETGVGKELFAQSIHRHSPRHLGPFVAVNCAAIPDALMESELFGYEEGAFTGSKKGGKQGLFEMAHGGTLFLDEIGEVNLAVQARLLRVIQEKEVMRVGGEEIIPVDVRIITATNVALEECIPKDFREDLYYRLDVLHLNVPALRERGEDILMLFQWFLEKRRLHHNPKRYLTEHFEFVLKTYSWPGNIRELQSVVERFAIQMDQAITLNQSIVSELLVDAIGADRLCRDIFKQKNYTKTGDKQSSLAMANLLESVFPSRKAFIAEKLGISRTTLWRLTNPQNKKD